MTLKRLNLKTLLLLLSLAFFISLLVGYFFDATITEAFRPLDFSSPFKKYSKIITDAGKAEYFIVPSLLLFLIGKLVAKKNAAPYFFQKSNEVTKVLLLSFLMAGAINSIIKFLVGRLRPYKSEPFNAFVFEPFSFHWDFQSFPSGHTQVTFTFAMVMFLFFNKLGPLFFSFAVIIASTRVMLLNHYLSDTLMGASIGLLIPLFIKSTDTLSK